MAQRLSGKGLSVLAVTSDLMWWWWFQSCTVGYVAVLGRTDLSPALEKAALSFPVSLSRDWILLGLPQVLPQAIVTVCFYLSE